MNIERYHALGCRRTLGADGEPEVLTRGEDLAETDISVRNDTEGKEYIVGDNLGRGRDSSRRCIKEIQCIISRNHTAIFRARTYGALVEVMASGTRMIS